MTRSRIHAFGPIIAVFIFFYGCAPKWVVRPPNPGNPIRRIAILPMLNNSDDVEAPNRARAAFFDRIIHYQYDVKPLDETNLILNEQMGITLGRQLDLTTPQQLGETLGVDGVFYGYLLNFDETTLGVANTYKVRIGWKLVDTKTGKIAWGKGAAVMRAESVGGVAGLGAFEAEKVNALPGSADPMAEMPGLDRWVMMENKNIDATQGLVIGLGGKLLTTITGTTLKKEMDYAYRLIFGNMLTGPGSTAVAMGE
ncbi:MAG: GNA1162 family protein [Nitrospiria bacterium]